MDSGKLPTVLLLLPVPEAPDPLDILVSFLPEFIDVSDDEVGGEVKLLTSLMMPSKSFHEARVAIAQWILHSYFYEQFETTLRLVLVSSAPGCGKSVVFECIESLGKRPVKPMGSRRPLSTI